MDISNLLDEYFLSIENNKDIEGGKHPNALKLIEQCDMNFGDLVGDVDILIDNTKSKEFFSSLPLEKRIRVFKMGISCFVHFVQLNFTGPETTQLLKVDISSANENFILGHEEVNPNTRHLYLLYISKTIFENCLVENIVNLLWTLRCMIIHQQIIEEPSPALLSQANDLKIQFEAFELPDYIRAKFDLEFAQFYLLLRHINKANQHLDSAENKLGIRYNFGGKLGKRTRYQIKDLAQMTLEVTLDNPEMKRPPVHDFEVPKDIPLKDDVRLDQIQFSEPQESVTNFPNTEQKFLLTRVQEMIIAKPKTELIREEILPFLDFILNQKNTWSVRVASLMLRCKYENSVRTISRKITQCEEILQSYDKPAPHVLNRFADVFSTGLKPKWKTRSDYAEALLSMGLVKDALNIYLDIKDWESVIVCYTLLKLRHKAAEVIEEQLNIKETPKLWCLLGDATDSVHCYEKAWELSKGKSHMAQRHWGYYLFERKEYQECIPHFEQSVAINPLQAAVWLRLGYSALITKNWQLAATAYIRYTHLEPEGFLAWNNLAQAYIKLGRMKEAHNALNEALKYNFDNWQIWENYLLVSCDIGNYQNVIQAYHRILDFDKKYVNLAALIMLTELSSKDDSDENVIKQTRELFGRITSVDTGNSLVWELYANISPLGRIKAERYQKAYRYATQQRGWEKNVKSCLDVLTLCSKMRSFMQIDDIDLPVDLLCSMRLNIRSALAAAKKNENEDVQTFLSKLVAET